MRNLLIVIACAVIAATAGSHSLDLPFGINFQFGFAIHVVPGPKDTSHEHGLVVTTDRILTDHTNSLGIQGTITNYGLVPCENIAMSFAVTSYIGIGKSLGRASVTPTCLQPGETATFSATVILDDEHPEYAQYTITAYSEPIMFPTPPAEIPSEALSTELDD